MKSKYFKIDFFFAAVIIALALQTAFAGIFDLRLMLIQAIVLVAFLIFIIIGYSVIINRVSAAVIDAGDRFCSLHYKELNTFSLPVAAVSEQRVILWYNSAFRQAVAGDLIMEGHSIDEIFDPESERALYENGYVELAFNDRVYKTFVFTGGKNDLMYFVDQTALKKTAVEYSLSRPAVAILSVDSIEEVSKSIRASEQAAINGRLHDEIEKWFAPATGLSFSLSAGKMIMIFEERYLRTFTEERFRILDNIRSLDLGNGRNVTLSIGVGYGCRTLREAENLASQALDMAQGRGGDQAAVKAPDQEYRFFGGVKSAMKTHNQVRTRIIASTLNELIAGSERVLLMGHKNSDLDCIGSSFALWSVANTFGKPAHILCDANRAAASPLLRYITENEPNCHICGSQEIIPLIDRKTLLIILDSHREALLEYPEVYRACKTVTVIDHHRKSVDFISNALIFYHETSASSTCEMTAELIRYMAPDSVRRLQAEALLSGIMLDTKNFVVNTGVRTYEAAAWLRGCGADPMTVKKLFSGNIETYRQRAAIVASAQTIGECAVAVNTSDNESTRVATAQAADELLNISGVAASFVLCPDSGKINISARSLGDMNVQIIMEKLGGGGHRTVAACQLEDTDFENAKARLLQAIEEYNFERKENRNESNSASGH